MEIVNSKSIQISLAPWDLTNPTCATRLLVLWRDKFLCIYCNQSLENGGEVIDHIVPESEMGSSNCSNLAACCLICNEKKGNALLSAEELRRIILKTKANSQDIQRLTGVFMPPVEEQITLHDRIEPKNCPMCDTCGKSMRIRTGRYGYFWGCTDYGICKGKTKNIGDSEVLKRIETNYPNRNA